MTKVFLSGSRQLARLNHAIRERIDNIVASGFTVLIGDANGADRAMQEYLAHKGYPKVIVFCTGAACRNNVGQWETRRVAPDTEARKDFRYYALKDAVMSKEATYGFAVWNRRSRGTLSNIINLLEQNKKVLVHLSPSNTFHCLRTSQDLDSLLESDGRETLRQFEQPSRAKKRAKAEQRLLRLA